MARWLLAVWLLLGAAILVVAGLIGQEPRPWGLAPEDFVTLRVLPGYGIWLLLSCVPATLAVADAVLLWQRRDLRRLHRSAVIIKLAGLPYFALSALIVVAIVLASALAVLVSSFCAACVVLAPLGILFGSVVVPILLGLTLLLFLPTTAYGIAALALLRGDRAVGRTFFIVNVVLQLLCLADLVSTVLMIITVRRVFAARREDPAVAEERHPELCRRYVELEVRAARLAAERRTDSDRTRLAALHGRLLGASTAGYDLIAAGLARRFHERIWSASGDPELARELQRSITAFWARRLPPPLDRDGGPRGGADDHEEILWAITERRPDDAERAVRDHLGGLRRSPAAAS